MKNQRKHYSGEFKIKAVELSNQRGNLTAVAEELAVHHTTLRNWKKQYKSGKLNSEGVKIKSTEELELHALKKELYEIKLERDILKKAVGIFSKSDR